MQACLIGLHKVSSAGYGLALFSSFHAKGKTLYIQFLVVRASARSSPRTCRSRYLQIPCQFFLPPCVVGLGTLRSNTACPSIVDHGSLSIALSVVDLARGRFLFSYIALHTASHGMPGASLGPTFVWICQSHALNPNRFPLVCLRSGVCAVLYCLMCCGKLI